MVWARVDLRAVFSSTCAARPVSAHPHLPAFQLPASPSGARLRESTAHSAAPGTQQGQDPGFAALRCVANRHAGRRSGPHGPESRCMAAEDLAQRRALRNLEQI